MKDYLVRDNDANEHAIIDAPTAIDAAQKYIKIASSEEYTPSPYALDIYPITRKNSILSPIDPLNGDRE